MDDRCSSIIPTIRLVGDFARPLLAFQTERIVGNRTVAMDQVESEVTIHLRSADYPIHIVGFEKLLYIIHMNKGRYRNSIHLLLMENP